MAKKLIEGLIVSCQALPEEPLYGGDTIAKMARAVYLGGAKGIRCLVDDVDVIAEVTEGKLPIIGLIKHTYPDSDAYITPTLQDVKKLMATKCDIIALDCTFAPHPNGEKVEDLVKYIRDHSDKYIMADVATLEEVLYAEKLGVDYISTTLRGYTKDTKDIQIPDISFLKEAHEKVTKSTLVAEGGIFERKDLNAIIENGIKYVVIGTAITRPMMITKYFNEAFQC